MKITIIVGARPNFIKVAPIIHSIKKAINNGIEIGFRLVHTGQHYDEKMSDTFFKELNIPHPDINLECGGGSQAEQTAAIMVAFEKELLTNPVDLVMVVGDVTSTMACSIVAKKLCTKVAHVEAGIRSGDKTMPEEINRIVTDSITDIFYTTTEWAGNNLRGLGVNSDKIIFVGNVMIDTLLSHNSQFFPPAFWNDIGLTKNQYFVLTLHRPSNVDESWALKTLVEEIVKNSRGLPIIFPIHPRTNQIFADLGISFSNLFTVEPLGYLQFNYLVQNAKAVVTDSGGITEETTVMGIPCMTLRNSTERPETVLIGTNELLGSNPEALNPAFELLWDGKWKKGGIPDLWDGKAADRIIKHIVSLYE
jgi:UDP-N-acetylglucosamine 2-epimerase (non-hydrolysing)